MDITLIIEGVIALIGIVLTRYAIPAFKAWVVEKNNKELDFWLNKAVLAVEEEYKNRSDAGLLKFDDVKSFLLSKGYTYDDTTIKILIDGI